MCCGDVESNPGPCSNKTNNLTVHHWNLNGLVAHNYVKVSLISSYLHTNKVDVLFLSETFLDSSVEKADPEIQINGYTRSL